VKFGFLTDLHLDASTAGVSRFDEVIDSTDSFVDAVKTQRIETAVLMGDYFDPGKLNASKMVTALLGLIRRISFAGASRVFVMAGNHDVIESSEIWTTISPLREVYGFSASRVFVDEVPKFHVIERARDAGTKSFGLLTLPFVARAAEAEANARFDEAVQLAQRANFPVIVAGHRTIEGAQVGSESLEMARGRDSAFPVEAIKSINPVAIFNGHYHRRQTIRIGGLTIHVPGSPVRFTFGEQSDGDPKGFAIFEVPE
jgi:DNA repair exonuclease SbcCD nuclease subunit